MGESSFWYRPTRVVPDQRPLNGRCCCVVPFFCIHILQGSVATCLKRGGIFKHEFVANLLLSRLVKKFENGIIVSEVTAKSLVSLFIFDSRCRK